jgi:hypothetical protein
MDTSISVLSATSIPSSIVVSSNEDILPAVKQEMNCLFMSVDYQFTTFPSAKTGKKMNGVSGPQGEQGNLTLQFSTYSS